VLWGAATSAYQVEGSNEACDWHEWERTRGLEPCGGGSDHLRRYPQDLALLAGVGLNCYRFSLEWSRIEPEQGRIDSRWLAHYRAMLDSCHEHGLEPIVTFHHFTNPRWLAAAGGWECERAPEAFARYCGVVARTLGERFRLAITINEPNIPALLGYELGWFPPGRHGDGDARRRVSANFIRAHALAAEAIRRAATHVGVGLALAMADWQALPGGEGQLDRARALREDIFLAACGEDDFVGVNVYTRHRIGPGGWVDPEPGAELTQAGYEFWPEAVEGALRRAAALCGRPLILTETGLATDEDPRRIEFIDRAVAALERARAAGADVRGFVYWSALDNFEWQHGYSQRFGLIGVDRKTLERTVRPSARHLGAIARCERRSGSFTAPGAH
jgi:beta-glucosidase